VTTEAVDVRSGRHGPDELWTARVLLPASERAPFAARRVVSTLLVTWGCADQVELAELVISELVSNAVRYAAAHGPVEVELLAGPDVIRLSVADGSPERPTLREDPVGERRGLGLNLVEQVAVRWGVEDYLLGKRVWLELPTVRDGEPA